MSDDFIRGLACGFGIGAALCIAVLIVPEVYGFIQYGYIR